MPGVAGAAALASGPQPPPRALPGIRLGGVANVAEDPRATLGHAIRLRREEFGISQHDLGLELDYDQGWVSHVENGPTDPAYGTVERDDPQKPAVTSAWFRQALLGQIALASGAADT